VLGRVQWETGKPTFNMADEKVREFKIFDPRDPAGPAFGCELADASVARRDNGWLMILAGQPSGHGATDLFSASVLPGATLSPFGWTPHRASTGELVPLAGRERSAAWDGKGGRHCPAYVKGWDPGRGTSVERIYYAGASENLWGPYTIGFLEWDGHRWVDQPEPVFVANEEWERGSVYEPNLIYHDGKWKMWYVAGSNFENYHVHGYSESADGRNGWSQHTVFADSGKNMFDFCVVERGVNFDAVFSRVWMGAGNPPAETGLWWCTSPTPSGNLADWSEPIQIMTAQSRGWHAGPWKPSLQFDDPASGRGFVFFDGMYQTDDPGPFPFVFTTGCLEINLPL
jgi:hypothetical protein